MKLCLNVIKISPKMGNELNDQIPFHLNYFGYIIKVKNF